MFSEIQYVKVYFIIYNIFLNKDLEVSTLPYLHRYVHSCLPCTNQK